LTIGAVLLAAGASRRLGIPKQLVELRGRPLLRAVVDEARSVCDRVLVVLGAQAHAIAPALEGADAEVCVNDDWSEGMASSVRQGIAWADRQLSSAALLLVCDQPALNARHLQRLVDVHRRGAPLVASRYAGTLGVPALFGRTSFSELRALRGDEGARGILRRSTGVAAVDWEPGASDVDTRDDIRRLDLLRNGSV
jgi:molybdenum cofactor cytidylyltransferase